MLEENLNQFEKTIIKLARTYYICPLEPCDIEQELRIILWKNRDKYNPKKSAYQTWATKVCKRRIWELARYYSRNNRDSSKFKSFEALKDEGIDIEG